ncbi:SGNH hydrolase-type esterase domain-containing protein [Apiospora kogelbergensis]|uniref:SGNH hydrolase-type esterase domain-containing protein n=1 Tax=Apiospora kogelbergensis TaxID=1337665 RepID=UPI00313031DD
MDFHLPDHSPIAYRANHGIPIAIYKWPSNLKTALAFGTTSTPPYRRGVTAAILRAGRTDYFAVDYKTGALGAWLDGCGNFDEMPKKHSVSTANRALGWDEPKDRRGFEGSQENTNPEIVGPNHPPAI